MIGRTRAHHHNQNPHAVAFGHRSKIVAGGIGISRLDPVSPPIAAQKPPVGIAHRGDTGILAQSGEQVVILRKIEIELAGQPCHVARCRKMRSLRQAMRVVEVRARHADCLRGAVHAPREGFLRSFQGFGDGDRRVIGRTQRRGADQIAKGDGLTGPQAQPRPRLCGRARRDPDAGVESDLPVFNRFKRDIQRHHLCQRRRVKPGCRICRAQHLASANIHDKGGKRGRSRRKTAG